jgi:hypothetical protein
MFSLLHCPINANQVRHCGARKQNSGTGDPSKPCCPWESPNTVYMVILPVMVTKLLIPKRFIHRLFVHGLPTCSSNLHEQNLNKLVVRIQPSLIYNQTYSRELQQPWDQLRIFSNLVKPPMGTMK